MKRLLVAIVLMLVPVLFVAGCSPTIGKWADRGVIGVENARGNVRQMETNLRKYLAERQTMGLDRAFGDIALCRDGKLVRPDGSVVEFDDKWLKSHKEGLVLLMGLWRKDEQKLEAEIAKAMQNLDHVETCFVNIEKLRKVWGTREQLGAEIDRLAGIVEKLIEKEK